ncbi:MAG: cellulase family glycosylhydrolase [Limisphaerales bacterium]
MKTKNSFGILSAFISLLMVSLFLNSGSAAGFLHTQGENIVDEHGQKIMLRGVGLGNWMLPEGYMWRFGDEGDRPRKMEKIASDLIGPDNAAKFWQEFRKQYITQKDIQRIAQLGFNSVRPALNARLFLSEGENPVYQDEGFELLDNLIKWCKQSGVYVIIDMHGAPGGQTGQNIDDSINDEPRLFMNPTNQDRLVALWVKIATRYKDEPTVAAYDLLNEPLPERTGAAAKYKNELEPLYKRITQAIRTVDKKHMITVEGVNWANDWSVFSTPFDSNLVYQFHYYCWDNPTKLKGIHEYLDYRKRLGAPVWVGETGEKDVAIYWGTTDYFEANNIGWSFWPWKKMDTHNTPYSIKSPKNWDAIRAYSRKEGADKPAPEIAQEAFNELLQNIQLANCKFFPDVVNALFRRVPGKVEAENYGQEGLDHSYSVKDPKQKSKFYRTTESVLVELVEPGQTIRLNAGEWTSYVINSLEAKIYTLTVRAKAENATAVFEISVNGISQEITADDKGWVEFKLKPVNMASGANQVKLSVKNGAAGFDWMEFR